MNTERAAPQTPGAGRFLRWIAAFKFVEALTMLATGLAALRLLQPEVLVLLRDWVDTLPIGTTEQLVAQRGVEWLTGLAPGKIKALGIGAFLFAAVFLLEGIGLWMRRLWGEWFTVVATSLLIPVEVREVWLHATPARLIVLIVNLLVVGYLIRQIRVKDGKH